MFTDVSVCSRLLERPRPTGTGACPRGRARRLWQGRHPAEVLRDEGEADARDRRLGDSVLANERPYARKRILGIIPPTQDVLLERLEQGSVLYVIHRRYNFIFTTMLSHLRFPLYLLSHCP